MCIRDSLGSEQRQRTTVLKELKEIVDIYGVDRKTEIIPLEDIPTYDDIPLVDEKEVPDEACIVTLSTSGKIGRTPIEGSSRTTPGQHDVLVSSGEQMSCALISGRLVDMGYKSRSWMSWQIPILSEGRHSSSRIIYINKSNIVDPHVYINHSLKSDNKWYRVNKFN